MDEVRSSSAELRWWKVGKAPVFAELLCGSWDLRPGHLLSGSVLLTSAGHCGSPGRKGDSSEAEELRGGDICVLTAGRKGCLISTFSE